MEDKKNVSPQSEVKEDMVFEESCLVEKVLDKRFRSGKVQYLLKVKGRPMHETTWESEEDIHFPDFMLELETNAMALATGKSGGEKPKSEETTKKETGSNRKFHMADHKSVDFQSAFKPKKIIRAFCLNNETMFLMEWKAIKVTTLVPAREANVKCPQLVIEFYEKRIKWAPEQSDETDEENQCT